MYNFLHYSNIVTHVVAGTIALLIGIFIFISQKGNILHKKAGRFFMYFLCVVIFSGLLGVFVFKRNSFLLVITLLAAYNGFSGYRNIKNKSNIVYFIDILFPLLCLASVFYFLYYFKSIGLIWEPVVIYSTIGALLFIVAFDFLRYLIPSSKYKNLWLYEHIYKTIGAFSALLAAFVGTVFVKYQPFSQILPSAFGVFLQMGFIGYYFFKPQKK